MSDARSWSTQQEAIFKEGESGTGNVEVEAYAGTGKTTTALEMVNRMPERRIKVCAFNKRIEQELSMRLQNPSAQAKTLHGIGYGCVRQFKPSVKLLDDKKCRDRGELTRSEWLTEQVTSSSTPDTIKKLITKLNTKGREIAPYARETYELEDIALKFECEPDQDQWGSTIYDLDFVVTRTLEAMELASRDVTHGIDFADMIFLPVRNRWMTKTEDAVIVDERQDMTFAQLEIAKGICKNRIVLIGDPNQAIYGFRGADVDGYHRLSRELNCKTYPLSVTYRCGRKIVELAQEFVPDFTAHESNSDGEVLKIQADKLVGMASHGDFILSRVNAPLVTTAMALLRNGKRARIAGQDIGKGLITLVRKLATGAASSSVRVFMERVETWREREVARFEAAKKPEKVESINDRAEMLLAISEGAESVRHIVERIEALFTDDGLGQAGVITCSSVHRAKGLEANRVFILRDTLRRYNQEELNIQYVAITRAKETLVWVGEERKDA